MSHKIKLFILAVILFTAIDEGVFRVLGLSYHPNPVVGITLFAVIPGVALLVRQINLLQAKLATKDAELLEEIAQRNKYFHKLTLVQDEMATADQHNMTIAGSMLSDGSYMALQVVEDDSIALRCPECDRLLNFTAFMSHCCSSN